MKKQKKSSVNNNNIMNSKLQNGITLIALVISIIVMLILAGVSINAVVGENGVLTKAQNASIESKKAGILEAIDLELASYNIDTILNKPEETSAMLSDLMSKGLIDTVLSSTGEVTDASQALAIPQFDDKNNYTGYTDYGVKKEDYSIILSVDTTGIYKAKYGEVKVSSGGSVAAGTTVVTGNAFNSGSGTEKPEEKGKFTIDNDASVMFVDEIEGELSIQVKAGKHAKINIFKNMTLTNSGVQRSAIDVEPGGILDLYVAEGATVTVNSGFGIKSLPATGDGFSAETGIPGGSGAYAGIHIPEGATLNVYGKGNLTAIGGDAGDGGDGGWNNLDWGGAGGGGAGAGIGGNGGKGGTSIGMDIGNPGDNGENAGNINIHNNVTVKAFGGTGGAVSETEGKTRQSGGGGSGFPAAGIGGGGAGGTSGNTSDSGGGFGAGNGEYTFFIGGKNGCTLENVQHNTPAISGSYYESYASFSEALSSHKNLWDYETIKNRSSGGIAGGGTSGYGTIPDSASAGKGGQIKVSSNAKIYAYNGSYITTKDTADMTENEKISTQALIYAQAGYDVKAIRELLQVKKVTARTVDALVTEWSTSTNNYSAQRTILSPYQNGANKGKFILGIGSGAGGSQNTDGNGTYTINESMN